METQFRAIIQKEDEWWVGWIEEIPGVNCQEKTREELIEALKITLKEALELNRQEAMNSAGPNYQEMIIAV
jgi:predicted RNase H-like HicB family nuclease